MGEIHTRAAQRIGQLSAELEKSKGGQNPAATLPPGGQGKGDALKEAGIARSTATHYEGLTGKELEKAQPGGAGGGSKSSPGSVSKVSPGKLSKTDALREAGLSKVTASRYERLTGKELEKGAGRPPKNSSHGREEFPTKEQALRDAGISESVCHSAIYTRPIGRVCREESDLEKAQTGPQGNYVPAVGHNRR
jgi:hypothetical protein